MSERAQLAELAKRRGFFFPANESHGGTSGFYVYGPAGASLKENIESAWRDQFTLKEGHLEIESPTIMPESVFEASGHLDGFADMLIECPQCHTTHRADHLVEDVTDLSEVETLGAKKISQLVAEHDISCPACGMTLAAEPIEEFNLMFGTNIGPGSSSQGYLRPETAQGIFVEFPRLAEYARGKLPFGVTQIGLAYRNEISPRRGLIRLREFTQAELELFIDPNTDQPPLSRVAEVELTLYPISEQTGESGEYVIQTVHEAIDTGVIASDWIAYYLGLATLWYQQIGIDMDRFRFRQHQSEERAHYAADCWDAEVEIDGDWIEVTGFAYRSDYDLKKHSEHTGEDFTVFKQFDEVRTVDQRSVDPDMSYLGPEFGEAAQEVATALVELVDRDPTEFDAEEVTVDINGESVTVPVERTGFKVTEETVSGTHIIPHVVEPSFGIDRLVYAVLAHSVSEDVVDDESRTVLGLSARIAPTFVGVFPLMDRDGLGERAEELVDRLRADGFAVTYDSSGSIGRRYRRQDEIGTPFCVTVDYDTLRDDSVTIRDRDTAQQRRVNIASLAGVLSALRSGTESFESIGTKSIDV